MRPRPRYLIALVVAAAAATIAGVTLSAQSAPPPAANTPIQHVVVIYDENESFDHYFGTYPNATNPVGEPAFTAAAGTPIPDNYVSHPNLLTANPNSLQPQRLDRSVAVPCDQNHSYSPEQSAAHGGLMDKFVEDTGGACSPNIVMDYYDGNTVTALWNYAQHYAMSDNFYGSTYGPSTPGALNLIAGNTNGAGPAQSGIENGTMIGDPNPANDTCGGGTATMSGTNIGDLMDTAGMTWGWFQGGFANCAASHTNLAGGSAADYSAHHEPFQYFASTANPTHIAPTSVSMIGKDDGGVHHQYDLTDFDAAIGNGTLPQVSFLKAPEYEDAHPGYSGPLDEQRFIVNAVNEIQQSADWASTAIIITYDDSDGWYDHQFITPTNTSAAASDTLTSSGHCGDTVANPPLGGEMDRCGPGPRLPFLVISPYAKPNYIDHTQLNQASIIKFIESNWSLPSVGADSFDTTAGDMSELFDFVGSTRTPKLTLNATTGLAPGGIITPPPPPPATTTTTTTAPPPPPVVTTTNKTAPPPPKKVTTAFKPKLSLTSKKSGKKLTVSLKVTGLTTSKGKITVSLKLTRSKKTVASASGTVKSGKVSVTLKAKKTLAKGSYSLTITVKQAGKSAKTTKTVKLK